MKWVESGGGPLIVVPEQDLSSWNGIHPGQGEQQSDYDLACLGKEDLFIVEKANAQILVLGDEPFRTTWWPAEKGLLLVRWIYAESEQAVASYLEDLGTQELRREQILSFSTPGRCLLFDSAEPGDDIRGDTLVLPLRAGTYRVGSCIVSPSEDLSLSVVVFESQAMVRSG